MWAPDFQPELQGTKWKTERGGKGLDYLQVTDIEEFSVVSR